MKAKEQASNIDDFRRSVVADEFESKFDIEEAVVGNEGRIFGLTAGERMILSIILFLAVTVLGIALLFATGTIVLR